MHSGLDWTVIVVTGAMAIVATSLACSVAPARATYAFAQTTKLPCNRCHAPAGSKKLTPFGEAFKANGNRLPEAK